MGSIYLIRHGQASFGAEDYDRLSGLGERQARLVGEHLARRGVVFERCLAGTLKRQQDTARLAMETLVETGLALPALETDGGFDEFDAAGMVQALLPLLEADEPHAQQIMRNAAHDHNEFRRLFGLLVEHWLEGGRDPTELEGWPAFLGRVEAAFLRVLNQARPQENVLVFTSAGVITALLHLITQMPANRAFEASWQIVNGSLSVIEFQGRALSLGCFNSDAHLRLAHSPELVTWL
jgi:broad specificity phosphatase PhoE